MKARERAIPNWNDKEIACSERGTSQGLQNYSGCTSQVELKESKITSMHASIQVVEASNSQLLHMIFERSQIHIGLH
jgi:hypothetical protein